jgi:hypothetical protein
MANTIEPSEIAYEPQWPLEFQPQTRPGPAVVVSGKASTAQPPEMPGGAVKLGDPNECRLHGMRCAELVEAAKTQQLKTTLLDLSKNWIKLAESLESTCLILLAPPPVIIGAFHNT